MKAIMWNDAGFLPENVSEYEIPIRGFLLKAGRLVGIYLNDGFLPVSEELPRDLNEDILRGRVKKHLLVREIIESGLRLIEAYVHDGYMAWLVHRTAIPESDSG